MLQKEFKVIDETGIHARPATLLVQAASKFQSNTLEFNGRKVNLKINYGCYESWSWKDADIVIYADGADEAEALALEETMKKEGCIKCYNQQYCSLKGYLLLKPTFLLNQT